MDFAFAIFPPLRLNRNHVLIAFEELGDEFEIARFAPLTPRSTCPATIGNCHSLGDTVLAQVSHAENADAGTNADIEFEQLQELAAVIPAAQMRELMASFDRSFIAAHEKLIAAAAQGDLEAAGCEAHDLKSITGNFGLRRLQHIAERIEAACKTRNESEAIRLVPEIAQAWIVARNLLDNFKLGEA